MKTILVYEIIYSFIALLSEFDANDICELVQNVYHVLSTARRIFWDLLKRGRFTFARRNNLHPV